MYTEKPNDSVAGSSDTGSLPCPNASLAFPYVPMQGKRAKRYEDHRALDRGTLFPGLDLPFHAELKTRFPAVNQALSELMALSFAVDELTLYLATHKDDKEAFDVYRNYVNLYSEGKKKYEEIYGPLLKTTVTAEGYQWLNDPWPWDEGGKDE